MLLTQRRRTPHGGREPAQPDPAESLTLAALSSGGRRGDLAIQHLRRFIVDGLSGILVPRGVPRDLCQDFAQEALLRVRAKLPLFRGDSTVEAWALSIAMRVALNELRKRQWREVVLAGSEPSGSPPPDAHAPAEQEKLLARARVVAQLHVAVEAGLTARQRHALRAGLHEASPRETASTLGINLNALYKLEHDARRRVKQHLEAAGLSSVEALAAFD